MSFTRGSSGALSDRPETVKNVLFRSPDSGDRPARDRLQGADWLEAQEDIGSGSIDCILIYNGFVCLVAIACIDTCSTPEPVSSSILLLLLLKSHQLLRRRSSVSIGLCTRSAASHSQQYRDGRRRAGET